MTPIQFGHLEIGGVTYPVKFGTAQGRDYCKALGVELKDYNTFITEKVTKLETSGDELITLVWSAFKQGARVEGKEFTLTPDDVADLIDYMNFHPDRWTAFFAIMQDAQTEIPQSPNETPAPQAEAVKMKATA